MGPFYRASRTNTYNTLIHDIDYRPKTLVAPDNTVGGLMYMFCFRCICMILYLGIWVAERQ